jgi:hypothetical protein
MNHPSPSLSAPGLSPVSLGEPGIGRLLAVYLAATLVACGICLATGGGMWAAVAALSSAACLAGAIGAHYTGIYPRGNEFITSRLMASTMVRMALPFGLLLVARSAWPELYARGMVYFVFLFYLVGLITWVVMRSSQLRTRIPGPAVPPAPEVDRP